MVEVPFTDNIYFNSSQIIKLPSMDKELVVTTFSFDDVIGGIVILQIPSILSKSAIVFT